MDDTTTSAAKSALRKQLYARRKAAHQAAADAALSARDHFLAGGFGAGPARVVSGYRPIRTEIDPTPLMVALIGAGHTLCVPVIEGAGLPLRFREWRPGCAMTTGVFGAEIPAVGRWLEPDLLITPLIAFDAAGWRLGYGGGFYDRTLAKLQAKRPTVAIGFAYAAQEVAEVPTDATDRQLDAIVTERGVIVARDGPAGGATDASGPAVDR